MTVLALVHSCQRFAVGIPKLQPSACSYRKIWVSSRSAWNSRTLGFRSWQSGCVRGAMDSRGMEIEQRNDNKTTEVGFLAQALRSGPSHPILQRRHKRLHGYSTLSYHGIFLAPAQRESGSVTETAAVLIVVTATDVLTTGTAAE